MKTLTEGLEIEIDHNEAGHIIIDQESPFSAEEIKLFGNRIFLTQEQVRKIFEYAQSLAPSTNGLGR